MRLNKMFGQRRAPQNHSSDYLHRLYNVGAKIISVPSLRCFGLLVRAFICVDTSVPSKLTAFLESLDASFKVALKTKKKGFQKSSLTNKNNNITKKCNSKRNFAVSCILYRAANNSQSSDIDGTKFTYVQPKPNCGRTQCGEIIFMKKKKKKEKKKSSSVEYIVAPLFHSLKVAYIFF